VNYGVQLMNKEKFYVTKDSNDIIQELYGYIWDMDSKGNATGKPQKKNDHAMNAMQYAVGYGGKIMTVNTDSIVIIIIFDQIKII